MPGLTLNLKDRDWLDRIERAFESSDMDDLKAANVVLHSQRDDHRDSVVRLTQRLNQILFDRDEWRVLARRRKSQLMWVFTFAGLGWIVALVVAIA